MAKKIEDMRITYISLVKAGANKKEILYKSDDTPPIWEKEITLIKAPDEEGIVYGVVYSPNEIDSQDEFATADEIKKAAYLFMKDGNIHNIDKNHSFKKENAFVCESFILSGKDERFEKIKKGSWVVGIKIDDEKLKKSIKDGEIKGISMAGSGTKVEVKKENKALGFDDMVEAMKKVFSSVDFSLRGNHYQRLEKNGGEELKREEFQKALDDSLKNFTDDFKKELSKRDERIEKLEKENKEVVEELKKSRQNGDPGRQEPKTDNSTGGIL